MERITFEPKIMGGKACIRGMRTTVAHVVNMVADGITTPEILQEHPDLEAKDIHQALQYAAAVFQESVHPLTGSGMRF